MQLLAVIIAGVAVGIADALIKKTSLSENFWMAFKNPWMVAIILLYVVQIGFFIYVFVHHWKLGIVGNLQMLFYSLTAVLIGYLIFKESLSVTQIIGIGLAIVAVFLING
jgi:drug/metabolite transporter (DMT)-like permease